MSNLPKKAFENSTKSFKKQFKSTLWYLFCKGKNFLVGDTWFTELWLINVSSKEYPVRIFFKTKIKVEILSISSSKFILGSIYDYKGKLVNEPKINSGGLININTILNNRYFKDKGLYNIYDSCMYPKPSIYGVLKNAYYYRKKQLIDDKPIDIIIPLQLINDFFFFSHSTKLNRCIINNTISESVKCLKDEIVDGKRVGVISQNRMEIAKSQALYYGRYFFTRDKAGKKAINQLRTDHLIRYKSGEKSVYFNSKIPFSFDVELDLIGQYIDEKTYLAFRIVGVNSPDKTPFFDIDKVVVSVLNDTRSVKTSQNKEAKLFTKVINKYTGIENNNEYNYSDQSGETYEIIEKKKADYSFNDIPENEVLPKDSNKFNYIIGKIVYGKEYKGGTVNLDGIFKEKGITKTNVEIVIYDLINWNHLIINTLIEICKNKGYEGVFLKLHSSHYTEIAYNEYNSDNNFDILSFTPSNVEKTFKFLLFKISSNNKTYYYFDKGVGTHSAFFSDLYFNEIKFSRLNAFLARVINHENLRWSKLYQNQKFKPEGIIVYQPLEHRENELKERLMKRLKF
ncbi:hypothetical protein [Pseudofulvibacter geojedonensis]|uniref:Piwi domain-containing protein n=1 Tax=Pseudofulvibacter geojedonensis TaxID=1123758 RepID=A0ABW3HYB5_9FLAO